MTNTSTTRPGETIQHHDKAADQIVKGCSNWHDIQYKIVPRIAVLLQERDAAATRMRDACVETVRAIHEERLRDLRTMAEAGDIEDEDTEYERAVLFVLSNVIDSLKSLTLDQVEQKQ